jgi:pimeloyl-ACP methyl ester carboxylesterase
MRLKALKSLVTRLVVNRSAAALLFGVAAVLSPLAAAAESKEAKPQDRFAVLDGMKVHYLKSGKGNQTVVLVHGWTCDANSWRFQLPVLSKDSRVIAIDLPGHGQSDKPHVAYTPELFARAINAVMLDAGVQRAVLVGHSLGTPIIRQFYRMYPKKTTALVIVDGTLRMPERSPAMEAFMASLRGQDYEKTLSAMVTGMTTPMLDASLREQVTRVMMNAPQYVAVSALESMGDEAIWKRDPINVPVLTVLAKSPAWAPDTEQFLRSLAPKLEYRMFEGVSHFLMMDKPDEFNQALSGFLSRNGLARKSRG